MPLPRASVLPDRLPVVQSLPALRDALLHGHAVLVAEPGSGKTTLVPLLLLDEPWLAGRRIVMLEPRRPAARMAARRMARLCEEAIGETVGYQVRFERKLSTRTRIEVLTEGLLLRRLQADPELADIGLVIFDEFHERNLQSDVSLALCIDVARGLRDDLRLLVMSATLDPDPLCDLLPAIAVQTPGRVHPVEVQHAETDVFESDLIAACLRLTERALSESVGDVLVFLPGRREIEGFLAALRQAPLGDNIDALALYGELPRQAQDRVLERRPDAVRRVIAATDIAETSVTIEGVSAVVDSGFARRPAFVAATGLTRLETRRVSRASAAQRAGRAGRLGPGHAYRAWTKQRHARLAEHNAPEIAEADLAPMLLELAAWGTSADALSWLTVPPASALGQARALLRRLGALQENGMLTAQGRQMVRLPVHPRLAHMLVQGAGEEEHSLLTDVAALLSEPDPLRGEDRRLAGADLAHRLSLLTAYRNKSDRAQADHAALRHLDRVAAQFRRLCPVEERKARRPMSLGAALLLAYPDRIAQCSPGDGRRYLLRSGRAAILRIDDPLIGTPYLVAASVDAGKREALIHLAAVVAFDEIKAVCGADIDWRREVYWDLDIGDVVARCRRCLGAIVLQERPDALRSADPVFDVLAERIRAVGLERTFELPSELLVRVELMRRLEPDRDWPDFTLDGLTASLADWLLPWLAPGTGLRALSKIGLDAILRSHLGRERCRQLDEALPLRITTPAGTQRRIAYSPDHEPVLALPMQELFGERVGPRLADGRVRLVFHLLSPAGRPLQVTSDLAAFWAGAYQEVKKEMRGRYPKHRWPDDPAKTPASRSLKKC